MDSRDIGWRSRYRGCGHNCGGLCSGLRHGSVLAPELGVDALEVIRARPEVLKRATRLIRSRVVVLLADL